MIPTVAYLAGFVGCALISYVLYPQSRNKKHHANGYPRALINCKNECFINVILQSLAASKKVTHWLLSSKSDSMSSKSLFDTLTSIIIGINRLENVSLSTSTASSSEAHKKQHQLINFEQDQDEFYAAQSFKAALNAHNWVIQSEEHDCHELFHLIMDVLDEEQLENKKSLSSLNYFAPSHLKDNSRVKGKNPFHGHLVSQLQCLDCNYKYPLRLESFYSLSLILPPQKPTLFGGSMNGVTLIECINNYFKTEHITGMKCENCPKLEHNKLNEKNRKGFIKKQAIAKLPDTLAIHIQRNSWSDQNLEIIKQTNYVQFPLSIKIDSPSQQPRELAKSSLNGQNLDFLKTRLDSGLSNSTFSLKQVGIGGLLGGNKHLSNPLSHLKKMAAHHHQTHQSYELRSAIVHFGNATSGHFVCFRQPLDRFFSSSDSTKDVSTNVNSVNSNNTNNLLKQKTENWLQISDSDIKLCKKYHLLSSNVYMLFYDKVASETQLNE